MAKASSIPRPVLSLSETRLAAADLLSTTVVLGGWDENFAATETIIWTCLGLALLFADFAIQWQDIRPARQVASKAVPISVSREESPA